ncbi:hypothetical protein COCMIDRAFT_10458 [Bipolaris oryzae ATCC 44560]|uniref:Uncharacterized protein n=1 Tax=Bipolaris oryzae ATCC 44560 TaxID=930090 RepID=W6Z701_COCMI|nr:uncharacterized protein COCMIDRAFT_10458 [Bipolaris oryzae ATCC 44560]EUC39461.1 hypothetical protein COCMIDRAFT_10458 [Bipolaris oryzae ATCC 44560]
MSGVGVAKLYKAEKATRTRHGCRSPPTLHVHWPFGLDRLKQMVQADAELRLMELFLFHFQQTGSTLEQKFLGTKVFGTMEPANLEAVLSTQAKGRCSCLRLIVLTPAFQYQKQDVPTFQHAMHQ